jgi:hypothetical protein
LLTGAVWWFLCGVLIIKRGFKMFGDTAKDLQDFYDEVNKGVEMANIYFNDNDIKVRAFPPYAFSVEKFGKENKDT